MRYRYRLIGPIVFAATVITVSAQPVAKTTTASKAWKQPMTPWGDPDLQGVWPSTSMLQTPMERDPKLGTRAVLNDQEVARRRPEISNSTSSKQGNASGIVPLAAGWFDYGKSNRQASLVVEPPDGRIPPLTAEAEAREAARKKHWNEKKDSPDTWLDLTTWDRCITLGPVGSVMPFAYNNGQQIVQGPGYVVFRNEMIHEARVIPVDGRPHVSPAIRSWMGDSRGHWEGNTLVVETTNFNGQTFIGSQGRRLWRFRRGCDGPIAFAGALYASGRQHDQLRGHHRGPADVDQAWKIAMPLRREADYDYIYEYACHEGNIFMHDALAGARAGEKKAAEAQKGAN